MEEKINGGIGIENNIEVIRCNVKSKIEENVSVQIEDPQRFALEMQENQHDLHDISEWGRIVLEKDLLVVLWRLEIEILAARVA